jgi:hypothetical protein
MTLRTATYDTATHKIVPIEPKHEQLAEIILNIDVFSNKAPFEVAKNIYSAAIAAAREYKDSE